MKAVDETAREIAEVFESLRLTYALMGGLAVRLYAVPRPTFDVDFTLALDVDQLDMVFDELEARGYIIPEPQRTGWIDRTGGMAVVKVQRMQAGFPIDIDIFLAESEFQSEVLRRRQRHAANGWQAWFVSPEDLLLLKLIAGRPKDLVDAADILFIQRHFDVDYLNGWADKLGLQSELMALLLKHEQD